MLYLQCRTIGAERVAHYLVAYDKQAFINKINRYTFPPYEIFLKIILIIKKEKN